MRRLVALAGVVVTALTLAGGAAAHASLIATSPANGVSLDRPPARLVLRYDAAVERVSGALRVFDEAGARVAVSSLEPLTARVLAADLPDDLPPGTYTVAWRVVSADSHPIHGAFVFAVGEPVAAATAVVERALADESAPGGLQSVQALARFAAIAFVLLCIGGPALLLGHGHGPHLVLTAWRTVLGAALGLGLATLVWLTATGAEARGRGLEGLVELESIRAMVGTSFGQVWIGRIALALGLAWIAALALAGRFGTRTGALAATMTAAGLAVTFPLAGHARVEGAFGVASDAIHTGAAGAWVGGLAVLGLALVTVGRGRRTLLDPSVFFFSGLALVAVGVLLATGIINALVELPEPAALWESTYGRLVLAKSALLAVLVGVGALHRRVTLPRLRATGATGATGGGLFLRVVGVELAVMAIVIGVIVALVATPPGRANDERGISASASVARLGVSAH